MTRSREFQPPLGVLKGLGGWDYINDATGRPVPRSLESVFRDRKLMLSWAKKLELLSIAIGAETEQEFLYDLDFDKLYRLLREAQTEIVRSAPFDMCDCPPHDRDCPECNGKRWRSKKTRNQPPAS